MARQGVTFEDVSAAIKQLQGQGKNPTIEQIRLILGTGSSTTIANHIKTWKASQSDTSLLSTNENIPQELVATMKGLWERVLTISDEKLQNVKAEFEERLAQQQIELDKYRQNNHRWQQLYHSWTKEKDAAQREKGALEILIESMKEEYRVLQTTYKLSTQQIVEKQERIQELHHHLKQSQKNYEENQKASSQQRREELTEFNTYKKELIKENDELKADLKALQKDYDLLKAQYHKNRQDNEDIKNQYEDVKLEIADCLSELEKSRQVIHESNYKADHWKTQYLEVKGHLDDITSQLIEAQSQIKFKDKQLQTTQSEAHQLRELHKSLEKENWTLMQEKISLA